MISAMRSTYTRRRGGFTLIEILAAVAILGMMALFLGRVFTESSRIWKLGSKRVESNGTGRAAIEYVAREVATAIVDDILDMELQSDKDTASFGSVTDVNKSDRLTFVCGSQVPEPYFSSGVTNAIRQYRKTTFRVMPWPLGDSTNYCLVQHNVYTSHYEYERHGWTTSFSDAANIGNSSVIAENIRNFEVYVYDMNGNSMSNYQSWQPNMPKPWFVDIYLEVLAQDDARRATLGLSPEEINRLTRRYQTRVYLSNTLGYSRDET